MLDSSKKTPETAGNSMGLKSFSATGREDSTYEVLKPQVSPAIRQRNLILTAVVVVLFGVMGYLAFQRSGLSFIPSSEEQGKSFAPPAQGGGSGD